MVNINYRYRGQPTPEDPNQELLVEMLSLLKVSDRYLKAAEQLLAPLEAEAALVLAQAQTRKVESGCATAPAAGSRIAAGIPRLRAIWLRFWSWCFGGKSLHSPTNV